MLCSLDRMVIGWSRRRGWIRKRRRRRRRRGRTEEDKKKEEMVEETLEVEKEQITQ